MPCYSPERKNALLKKLLLPLNLSVAERARQEGISEMTLYAWRKQPKAEGAVVPGDKKLPDAWPAEAKFVVALETATLSEIEPSEYCATKGCIPSRSMSGAEPVSVAISLRGCSAKEDKKRIREQERELQRKAKVLAKGVLREAFAARQPKAGLLFHTDRGTEYRAQKTQAFLNQNSVRHNMNRPGQCTDNTEVESFFKTLKGELLHTTSFVTMRQLRKHIKEYIEGFYNSQRLHSGLGYRTPIEFEGIS